MPVISNQRDLAGMTLRKIFYRCVVSITAGSMRLDGRPSARRTPKSRRPLRKRVGDWKRSLEERG